MSDTEFRVGQLWFWTPSRTFTHGRTILHDGGVLELIIAERFDVNDGVRNRVFEMIEYDTMSGQHRRTATNERIMRYDLMHGDYTLLEDVP